MQGDDTVAACNGSEGLLEGTAFCIGLPVPNIVTATCVTKLVLNALGDEKTHGNYAVATVLVGESLLIGTAFCKGHVAPFVIVAGIDGVGYKVLIRLVDSQVQRGDAVTTPLVDQGDLVGARFEIGLSVPNV